jgi:hypothetical protein
LLLDNRVDLGSRFGDATNQPTSVVFAQLMNKALTLLDEIKNLVVDRVDRFLSFRAFGWRRVFHEVDLRVRVGERPNY